MRKVSTIGVSAVVAGIYEAAYDQNRWMDAMKSVCDLFHGSRACIVKAETSTKQSAAIGSYRDDEFTEQDWEVLGASLLASGMRTMAVGNCYRRGEVVDETAFRTGPMWRDYFRPRNMDDNLSCNLRLTGDSLWSVDIARAATQGEFGRDEIRLLSKLTPHLLRAGEIGNALQGASTLSSLYAELPFGMMIVDRHRHVYHLNKAAEETLASTRMPLTTRDGRLSMTSSKDAAQLERMIASACGDDNDGLVGAGGTAIFPQVVTEPGQRRLLVSVAPLSTTLAYGLPTRRNAAIMIREIGKEAGTGLTKALPRLFGLSPAEARIAAGLVEGKALKEIAAEHAITVKTARSYLETVFRKTGTHRQSELVAILKTTQPILF